MPQCYSTKAASRRWPLAAFFSLLDIISLDSFAIARDIGMTRSNRRHFLIQLGEIFCTAGRHKRAAASQPLQFAQQASTRKGIAAAALPAGKRTACGYCQKNKTRSQCSNCTTHVCGSCSKLVYKFCFSVQD